MSNKAPSPAQIRAACAILKWDYKHLAHATGLSVDGISRICLEKNEATGRTRDKIRVAFEAQGIEFLPDDGVKRHFGTVDRLAGHDALYRFFDDVYSTVKDGGTLCVSGVDERQFAKFNIDEEAANHHRTRMAAIKDKINFRVLLKEGDTYFRNDSYIEYRWMQKECFFEHPIYVYNNKLAFIKFENDNLEILRIAMPSMAAAFRAQFDFIWNHSKIPQKREGDE